MKRVFRGGFLSVKGVGGDRGCLSCVAVSLTALLSTASAQVGQPIHTTPFQQGSLPLVVKPSISSSAVALPSFSQIDSQLIGQIANPARPVQVQTSSAEPVVPAVPASSVPSSEVVARLPVFGPPRTAVNGVVTRVVFDLPVGSRYGLRAEGSTLRVRVSGAQAVQGRVQGLGGTGSGLLSYQLDGSEMVLRFSEAFFLQGGWRSSEVSLPTGKKALLIEVGAGVAGGMVAGKFSDVSLAIGSREVVSSALASRDVAASGSVPQVASRSVGASVVQASAPASVAAIQSVRPVVSPVKSSVLSSVPQTAVVAGSMDSDGRIAGRIQGGVVPGRLASAPVALAVPRVAAQVGITRLVFDLPAGVSFSFQPATGGIWLNLQGVSSQWQAADIKSAEVSTLQLKANSAGVQVWIPTNRDTTWRSGWRSALISPATGSTGGRLLVDLSPAIADVSPVPRAQMAVAPINSGPSMLAVLGVPVRRMTVVLDPGHGGVDQGAEGVVSEAPVNLVIALKVRDLLRTAGIDVVMTRETNTQLNVVKDADLRARSAMAQGANIYVSIHVNALVPKSAAKGYGIETWWNPNHQDSRKLASILQAAVVERTGAFSRGLRDTQSLAVLRSNPAAAALVEVGFTSHPVDGMNLRDQDYLDRVSLGIAEGIRQALVEGVGVS